MNDLFLLILAFTLYWDYKPTNAIHSDSWGVYTSDNMLNLSTVDKHHLKCVFIDGSVVNGLRQPFVFSFFLNEPRRYKVFCEPETIHYKKISFDYYNFLFRRQQSQRS